MVILVVWQSIYRILILVKFTILFGELLELAIWGPSQTEIKATKIARKTLVIIYHCIGQRQQNSREVQEVTQTLSFCQLTNTAKEKKGIKSFKVKKATSHMFISTTSNRQYSFYRVRSHTIKLSSP